MLRIPIDIFQQPQHAFFFHFQSSYTLQANTQCCYHNPLRYHMDIFGHKSYLHLQTVFWAMNTAGYFDKHRVTWYNRTIIKEICTIPSWLNYSCNFFIYILANSNFRKDLKSMLRSCRSCLPGRSPTLRPANNSISTGISSLSTVQHTNQPGISSSEAL